MYLYVTSNVNNGHKIGITDDLLKRKIAYNTIFPDLEFLITIFSQDAIFIEESFKSRFDRYRKFSGNSDRKSEIYELYFDNIARHIIRCHHACGKALLIPSNHMDKEYYNTPYEGSTTYYLSNHYFIDRKKNLYDPGFGINERLIIGTIYYSNDEKKGKWLVKHLSFEGFEKQLFKIKQKTKEQGFKVPIEQWESFESFGKSNEIYFPSYFSALNYLQTEIFSILLKEKIIIRPYDFSKFKKYVGWGKNPLANYSERIFFGRQIWGRYRNFNLGTSDDMRYKVRKDRVVPKELIKYYKKKD